MSFLGGLKKVGKVALMAAPYVAAPFTGGASLAATGLANKAVSKWSEHDAKDAIAHGLAPSHFDQILNKAGTISSIASSVIPTNALGSIGMLGKAAKAASVAGKAGKVASAATKVGKVASIFDKANKVANVAGPVLGAIGAARAGSGPPSYQSSGNYDDLSSGLGPSSVGQAVPRNQGAVMPRGGYRYNDNPMNQLDQSSPNLSQSIFQGRQEAIKNQPFRRGYDITTNTGETDEAGKPKTVTRRTPKIYELPQKNNGGRRKQQEQVAY